MSFENGSGLVKGEKIDASCESGFDDRDAESRGNSCGLVESKKAEASSQSGP